MSRESIEIRLKEGESQEIQTGLQSLFQGERITCVEIVNWSEADQPEQIVITLRIERNGTAIGSGLI